MHRQGHPDRALLHQGQVVEIQPQDPRLAIRLIDIKHTNPENIGKKHFCELLFYAHALAFYLHETGLDDQFFVSLDGHGIWPAMNLNRVALQRPEDVSEALEPMEWDNHAHLFALIRRELGRQRELAPYPVEDMDVHIQPACARCLYVEDCKQSLGFESATQDMASLNVRLVPCSSRAIVEQLRDRNIETVAQLHAQLPHLPLPLTIPSPLHAERALLMLKAEALLQNKAVLPDARFEDQQMSMALPYSADTIVTFSAEADPTNDCVFAFGLCWDVHATPTSPWLEPHERWWAQWEALLERFRYARAIPGEALERLLDPQLIEQHMVQQDVSREHVVGRMVARLKRFAQLLWRLRERGDLVLESSQRHRVRYTYAFVSQGIMQAQEQSLCVELVRQAQALLELSAIYELFMARQIPSTYKEDDTYTSGPSSCVFYWSHDQLEHMQQLLERHLHTLLTDPRVCEDFDGLMRLINPAQSRVQRDYMHRKVYDLRAFVETSMGLPQIVNYTWHEVARQTLGGGAWDRRFWPEHFNYMDFIAWHDYLHAQDPSRAQPLRDQACLKAHTLARLGRRFLSGARAQGVLSSSFRAIRFRQAQPDSKLAQVNVLARAWALYSKLTASVQAADAQTTRLNAPSRSIGKLAAAQVVPGSIQTWWDEQGAPKIALELAGVSTNMKLSEGSYVLLMHSSRRGGTVPQRSREEVIVERMRWDQDAMRYHVQVHPRDKNHPLLGDSPPTDGHWYLYPNASDTWSNKLFEGKDNLYKRHGLGQAWLGDRFAYLLDLLPAGQQLPAPDTLDVPLPQVYAYAPNLLPQAADVDGQAPLMTTSWPAPDPSQRAAIHASLAHTVSCIQGPPGTGKSQTIAALIDEFAARHPDRPLKILVTSFSYNPLHVVLDKLMEQRDAQGRPTPAASMQKVFMRSQSREPVERRGVHDLYRSGGSLVLDGSKLARSADKHAPGGRRRMEDYLEDRVVIFAPAQQLFYVGKPSDSKSNDFHFVHDDFAFDLIIVDEASQMPVDQALTSLCLVTRATAQCSLPGDGHPASVAHKDVLRGLRVDGVVDRSGDACPDEALTRVVVVGDHNQLPPVQQVEVSRKLQPILTSLFSYYVQHHGIPTSQLMTNYRSHEDIVGFTRHLRLYERRIQTFHQDAHAYPPLPEPSARTEQWVRQMLRDERVVQAIVHTEQYQTALSPLEARITRALCLGFFEQMGVDSPQRERAFWREDLGIVAPHNAQGRLIIRYVAQALQHPDSPVRTHLEPQELEQLLRETIYSVERFQGSARTFIIASMGVSAVTQLSAEEAFLYDMNRLNVLTSRAKQKMVLICSQEFLDYMPRLRDVVPTAARFREYVHMYCNAKQTLMLRLENSDQTIETRAVDWHWHDPEQTVERIARAQKMPPSSRPSPTNQRLLNLLATLGISPDDVSDQQRALLLAQLKVV